MGLVSWIADVNFPLFPIPTRLQLRTPKLFSHPPNLSTKALFLYSPWLIIGGHMNGFSSGHHLFYTFSGAFIFDVQVSTGESFMCLICRVRFNWDTSTCTQRNRLLFKTIIYYCTQRTKYYCFKIKSCLPLWRGLKFFIIQRSYAK